MKKIIKLSVVAVGLLFVTGCKPPKVDMNKHGKINDIQTDYTQALRSVNSMIAVFHGKPVSVDVAPIKNKTAAVGKLPQDISIIVKKSFNSIGTNVKTMYRATKNSGAYYKIEGAITEFDLVTVSGSSRDAAGKGSYQGQQGSVDYGLDKENKLTKLAITFNPIDSTTANYVPNASTSNRIEINQKSAGDEIAISILGSGIGLSDSITKAQGVHSSINILVELSVVELLGKLTNYPYWLLTRGSVNQEMVANLSRKFVHDKLTQKIKKVSYLLGLRGYDVQATTMMNSALKTAIVKYKTSKGMVADDSISTELYKSLLGA